MKLGGSSQSDRSMFVGRWMEFMRSLHDEYCRCIACFYTASAGRWTSALKQIPQLCDKVSHSLGGLLKWFRKEVLQ